MAIESPKLDATSDRLETARENARHALGLHENAPEEQV